MGGKRLLDQLDTEPKELRQEGQSVLWLPAGIGVDAYRSVKHGAHSLEGLQVVRAAALDLERRKVGRPRRTPGDDFRAVDTDREVGRRNLGRQAEELVEWLARD